MPTLHVFALWHQRLGCWRLRLRSATVLAWAYQAGSW